MNRKTAMKKRHSVEQIIRVLKQVEGGTGLAEVCRGQNISEQTYYRWKRKRRLIINGDIGSLVKQQ